MARCSLHERFLLTTSPSLRSHRFVSALTRTRQLALPDQFLPLGGLVLGQPKRKVKEAGAWPAQDWLLEGV